MKILLTGASGFIGGHTHTALVQAGHVVVPVSRRDGHNFNQMTAADDWLPLLEGVDAVINSVGIIAETRGQSFDVLHHRAPAALFRACEQVGVKRVIQVSALGADDEAFAPYQLTKKAADDTLRSLDLDWFVLRPSLVYGKGGASSAMFRRMASLPIIPLVGDGKQRIQPVHVSDVVATIMTALTTTETQRTLDVVGPHALTFVEWLQSMRLERGKKSAWTLPTPLPLVMANASIMRYIVPMMHPDNLRMLQAGSTSTATPITDFLGRPPLSVEEAHD